MATYAIGDVQGCFASLMALLDAIRFNRRRDAVWFTGDLVNRGPDSLGVLRFVADLGPRAVCVLGNHDLHLLAVAHGQRKLRPKDTLRDILEAPDRDALLGWLRHRPLLHHDTVNHADHQSRRDHGSLCDTRRVSLIHAGLPPQWTLAEAQHHARTVEAGLQGPDFTARLAEITHKTCRQWTTPGAENAQRCYTANCLTLLRYCSAEGVLDLEHKGPPGTQPQPYLPWFAVPHRAHAGQNIVFGHWASLGGYDAPGMYGLDTACVWGGRLTAMCLETKRRTSVACQETALSGVS
jgi:bis(5'-nucleosyl)-tetraphosphatase (symmetrical)